MYVYNAKYVKTIDGDTVDALVDLGFGIFKAMRIRLAVVDTPEKSQPGWSKATEFTKSWFEAHPEFILRTNKDRSGGFDRYLGYCYSLDMTEDVSSLLLTKGLAKIWER